MKRQHHPTTTSKERSTATTVNLLAQELEARKELLEALVKDKNDTVV